MWKGFLFMMASDAVKRSSKVNGGSPAPKKFSPWNMGLKTSMEDPELKVLEDDKIVIIKDKYPKARFHFLVLPKESIPNMKSLTREHIPLLKHMHDKGQEVADSHIHLHVISQDFDSPCLKTKKHWNSFTTEYFVNANEVITMLENDGKFHVDTTKYSDILKRNLKCHICKKDFSTMPALKQHILIHIPAEAKS